MARTEVKEPEMRVVRHALISFVDVNGAACNVMRNQEVDVNMIPAKRRRELEEAEAFAPEGIERGDLPNLGNMKAWSDTYTEQEVAAWVRDAQTDDIIEVAKEDTDRVQRLLDGEAAAAHEMGRPLRDGLLVGLQAVASAANT